jgi:hypothetical protein
VAGRIFPVDGPRAGASHAEAAVHAALRAQLPDGWTAWHALRLRSSGRSEGEADFVIAAPGRGVLIVEVKGGRIELVGGHWRQNGAPLDRAPRQQAVNAAHLIEGLLRARGVAMPPYESASVFPETEFSMPPGAADVVGMVLGKRDLTWLGHELPGLFERALAGRPPPADDRWIAAIHALWGETWIPSVTLADQTRDAARRLLQLDDEQLTVLDYAGTNPRAIVEGGAGTGKTVVAGELVARRARAGQRALYVCFTDALARVVDRNLAAAGLGDAARAVAIRRHACELLAASGAPLAPESRGFWDEVSLQAACAALPPLDARPDLVVVDEAQDLEPSDWVLIEELARGRDLWIFGDEQQRFWDGRGVPPALREGATVLTLRQQRRSPEAIAAFAAAYVGGPRPTRRPDPSCLRVVVAADPLDRVRHELAELRRAGIRAADCAVLTLAGRGRSRLLGHDTLGAEPVALADADAADGRVVVDTFLRFKGLERAHILITEPLHGPAMKYATRMHLALTRATVSVTIVCDEAALAQDEHLAWLRG